MDGHVTTAQAALALGVTRQRIHALIQQGKLPAVRVSERQVLVPVEAVRRRAAMLSRYRSDDLLTAAEAARRVGRSPDTIREWVKQGRLRSESPNGKTMLIRASDLDRLVLPRLGRPPRQPEVSDG